jgi:signal transduction histidine kinase
MVAEIEAQPAGTAAGDADGGAAAEATRRRDALARLASGVAHDLNNILAALSVELELLAGAPELPAQLREDLALARTALDRGATLTRQLQAFGRRLPARPRRCDLGALVSDLVGQATASTTHPIHLGPDAGPLPIDADPDLVSQAMRHLLGNAREAMPGGGTTTVETGRATVGPATGWVRVHDRGGAIPPASLPQVFEPFFPARVALGPTQPSKRPGLALALALTIAEQHGGTIEVASDPDAGTTFTLRLPLAT